MVNVSLRVLSRPQVNALPTIYRNLGEDYDDRVLPSIVNEVLKSELARFNAAQLITQRDRVSDMIRQRLTERATEFWLALDDVSITDLGFGTEYTAAVEAKQVAQQDAQRAALEVERARQDRQRTIVNAEGEAKSAALIGEAVKQNPGFLNLRRIEAARSIAGVVAGSTNRVYLDSNQLLLNVGEFEYDRYDAKAAALGAIPCRSPPAPCFALASRALLRTANTVLEPNPLTRFVGLRCFLCSRPEARPPRSDKLKPTAEKKPPASSW